MGTQTLNQLLRYFSTLQFQIQITTIEIHRKYYGNMSVEQPSLSSDKVSLSENQVLTPQNLHFLRDRDPVAYEAGISYWIRNFWPEL